MIVIAHRGHSAGHPENSEAAFEAAIAAGADMIETDLRLTRDGAVVCCHDPDLSRVAGHAGAIADLDATAIAALRRSDGNPAALKLERVLDLAKGRARVLLDVKEGSAAMLDSVLPILAQRGMAEQVVYGARSVAHLTALRRRAPAMETLGLVGPDEVVAALDAGAATIRLWERHLDDGRPAAIREAGGRLCVMVGGQGTGRATGDIDRAALAALVVRWHPDAVMLNDPTLPAGR